MRRLTLPGILREWTSRTWGTLARRRSDSDLARELAFHLEQAEDDLRRQGYPPAEASRLARVQAGGSMQALEALRERRGFAVFSSLWLDVRLGLRLLRRSWGLTLAGGLGIAVAVAIGSGVFSFFNAFMHPSIPLDEGDRLVAIANMDIATKGDEGRSLADFAVWRTALHSVRDLSAFETTMRALQVPDGTSGRADVAEMTASAFDVARVQPLLGRYLVSGDEREGAPRVVVIGHLVWRVLFHSDPETIGRQLHISGTPHTIVGVMPEGFRFPVNHHVWIPLRGDLSAYGAREGPEVYVFGRLAPGISHEQAQAELTVIGQRAAAASPRTHRHLRPTVFPYAFPLLGNLDAAPTGVYVVYLAVSLLLVVVAANVAILVYARTAARQRELAIRTALGASRGRIVMQLFVEALLLSTVGSAIGLAMGRVGLQRVLSLGEVPRPFWLTDAIAPATFAYVAVLAVLAAVIAGALPALRVTSRRLQSAMGHGAHRTGDLRLGRTWSALVIGQVGVAVFCLPVAVNLGWDQISGGATRPAFVEADYLIASLRSDQEPFLDPSRSKHVEARVIRLAQAHADIVQRFRSEPGVSHVTIASDIPRGVGARIELDGAGASARAESVRSLRVGLDFFAAFDLRVQVGRAFNSSDLQVGATPVIVNRSFVRKVLDGSAPLGRRVRYADHQHRARAGEPEWYEIVGVVDDLYINRIDPNLSNAAIYHPFDPRSQEATWLMMVIRGGDHAHLLELLRTIDDKSPEVRLTGRPLSASGGTVAARVLVGAVLAFIILAVLLLSCAGIYTLMAFTVVRRRREIGIRSALGANARHLLWAVYSRVLGQLAAGIALGTGAAALDWLTGGRIVGGQAAFVVPAIASLMMTAGVLAAMRPAWRGLHVPPTEALRDE